MTTVLLVRHGRTTANATGLLAGHTPGVHLDDTGREQVRVLGDRIRGLDLAAIVSSPLERTVETAQALVDSDHGPRPLHLDDGIIECRYGDWTGRELKALAKEPMWKTVQGQPSAVRFPGDDGETMHAMQQRAVDCVRAWNARLGDKAMYAVVSHGDIIKAILADALGMHLDQFQRIHVDPASVSVVSYSPQRPSVLRMNDRSGDVGSLVRPARRRARASTLGGGAG